MLTVDPSDLAMSETLKRVSPTTKSTLRDYPLPVRRSTANILDPSDALDELDVVDPSVTAAAGAPRTRSPRAGSRAQFLSDLSLPGLDRAAVAPRIVRTPALGDGEPWPPKVSSDPHKVLLLHIDPAATDADVRIGFESLDLQTPVQVKRIEFYTDHSTRTTSRDMHAFVSLGSHEDFETLMSDTVRPFGVWVNHARCALASVQDRRIVYVRSLRKEQGEGEIRLMLAAFGIMESQIERVDLATTDSGAFTGSCSIFFHSHADAYRAIRYLNNADGKLKFAPTEMLMSATWGRAGLHSELRKKKDELHRENKSLKEQISRLTDEVKKMDHTESVAEVSLNSVIFKRARIVALILFRDVVC